ncbi:RICIN domain-containing protein [Streptomyces tsukubensis]|uniref:RICIN domain-containing protein n=1 Tax=Streptomyces tsukubensis TaxID=83656 RepID=UPI0036BFA0CC
MRRRFLAALSAAAGLVLLLPAAPAQALPGTGPHTITVDHSGKCLGLERDSADDWVRLVTATCDGSAQQRFTLAAAANVPNTYQFRTSYGKCLMLAPIDGREVHQFRCMNSTNDAGYLMSYHPWPGEQIRFFRGVEFELHAFCWHVRNAWTGDGATVIPHQCNNPGQGARNDTFHFHPA